MEKRPSRRRRRSESPRRQKRARDIGSDVRRRSAYRRDELADLCNLPWHILPLIAGELPSKDLVKLCHLCPQWARFCLNVWGPRKMAARNDEELFWAQVGGGVGPGETDTVARFVFYYAGDVTVEAYVRDWRDPRHVLILSDQSWQGFDTPPNAVTVQFSDRFVLRPEKAYLYWKGDLLRKTLAANPRLADGVELGLFVETAAIRRVYFNVLTRPR